MELPERMNLALVTIDSLRFDTTKKAKTPNLKRLFAQCAEPGWVSVWSNATYTLPAHIALLHEGRLPSTQNPRVPGPYNRNKEIVFRAQLPWKERDTTYPTPPAENIVRGFAKLGYRTIGVGGVHWFDTGFDASAFWQKHYFDEFHWDKSFAEDDPRAFENQLACLESALAERDGRNLFLFMNIASTHSPFMGNPATVKGQALCLDYVDSHFDRLVALLPRPCHLFIMGDHGECFGENGLYGHGFYHPKVMEVPMVSLRLR